jgi:hypothetical protein
MLSLCLLLVTTHNEKTNFLRREREGGADGDEDEGRDKLQLHLKYGPC